MSLAAFVAAGRLLCREVFLILTGMFARTSPYNTMKG
jgi:hypothetical protein